MKYVCFPKGDQTVFLKNIKEKSSFTWKEIFDFLDISKSMFYFYLNEHSKIPFSTYLRLCALAQIVPNEKINSIEIKNKLEDIRLPILDSLLAEFLGVLAGDGHMNYLTYEVSISLDKDRDSDYSSRVFFLFKTLFGLDPKIYIQPKYNQLKCFVYSRKLVDFLSKTYGVPIGRKMNQLNVPSQILSDDSLLKAYLRGVFDTDGSFHRHHETSAALEITSRDTKYINQLFVSLKRLGFKPSLSNKNIYIYRKEEIERFFDEVSPQNKKHTKKFIFYKKNGFVPLTRAFYKR